MTHSPILRCTGCLRRYVRTISLVCVCGGLITAQAAIPPLFSYWGAKDGKDRGEFQVVLTGTNAATTSLSATTIMYLPDTILEKEIEVPGAGFHAKLATVPAEQRPAYKPIFIAADDRVTTDVSSGTSAKPPQPRSS